MNKIHTAPSRNTMFPQHKQLYEDFGEYLSGIPGAVNSVNRFRNMMYYIHSLGEQSEIVTRAPDYYAGELPIPEHDLMTPENSDESIVESNNLWYVFKQIYNDNLESFFTGASFEAEEVPNSVIFQLGNKGLIENTFNYMQLDYGDTIDTKYDQIVASKQLLSFASDDALQIILQHIDEYDRDGLINLFDVLGRIDKQYIQYFKDLPNFYSLKTLQKMPLNDLEFYSSEFVTDYITHFDLDSEVVNSDYVSPEILTLCYPETVTAVYKKNGIDMKRFVEIAPDYKVPKYIIDDCAKKYLESPKINIPEAYTIESLQSIFVKLSDNEYVKDNIIKKPDLRQKLSLDIVKIGHLIDQMEADLGYYQKALSILEQRFRPLRFDFYSRSKAVIDGKECIVLEISIYDKGVVYTKFFVDMSGENVNRYLKVLDVFQYMTDQTYNFNIGYGYNNSANIIEKNNKQLLKLILDPEVKSTDWKLVENLIK